MFSERGEGGPAPPARAGGRGDVAVVAGEPHGAGVDDAHVVAVAADGDGVVAG